MPEDTERTDEEREQETAAKADELGDAGKRALDAERKARKAAEKRAQDAEAKVKQAEDAEKTEVQRLTDLVDELKKRAEEAEAKALRFTIAAAKELSLAQARRLVGSTQEELEADADAMRSELGLNKEESEEDTKEEKQEAKDESGRPKENLRAGASNEEDEQPDSAKLADEILGGPGF